MNMSSFLLAITIMSLITGTFMIAMSVGSTTYNVTYSNSSYQIYNQFEKITNQSQELQKASTDLTQPSSGVFDVAGNLFSQGFKAIILSLTSFDTFRIMADQGINSLNLGLIGTQLRVALMVIMIIVITFGLILRIVMRTNT